MAQWQQRQQNVKDLFSSLKAGDLAGAQKAMTALNPSGQTGHGPMAAIFKALQNNDLQGAEQAAQSVHHHHRADSTVGQQAVSSAVPSVAPSTQGQLTGLGSLINTSA
jgi:hypothetical protein